MFYTFKEKKEDENGEDVHYHTLCIHYLIMQTCLALEQTGVFDLLRRGEQTVENLAYTTKTDEVTLQVCLHFLWSVTDFLDIDGNLIKLRNSKTFPRSWILLSYKQIFDNLAPLLTGRKEYKKELFRDGAYLQKASGIFFDQFSKTTEEIINRLRDESDQILVDLGCGSARVLQVYCSSSRVRRAVGVEVDATSIQETSKMLEKNRLSDQISLVQADIRDIEKWKEKIPEGSRVAFLASTVLHELLFEGEEALTNWLTDIKDNFPRSRFFIVEYDGLRFEDIKHEKNLKRKHFAAMYTYWHPLTKQGLPQSKKKWESIINSSGWHVQDTIIMPHNFVLYDCVI